MQHLNHKTLTLVFSVFAALAPVGFAASPKVTLKKSKSSLSLREVETLATEFYSQFEEIHATSDYPNRPGTPMLKNLDQCQIKPQRELIHPAFTKFFSGYRFFAADSCKDGKFIVTVVDKNHKLGVVMLYPELRTSAGLTNQWEEISQALKIQKPEDIKDLASVTILLNQLVEVPANAFQQKEREISHYKSAKAQEITFWIDSKDSRVNLKHRKLRPYVKNFEVVLYRVAPNQYDLGPVSDVLTQ